MNIEKISLNFRSKFEKASFKRNLSIKLETHFLFLIIHIDHTASTNVSFSQNCFQNEWKEMSGNIEFKNFKLLLVLENSIILRNSKAWI